MQIEYGVITISHNYIINLSSNLTSPCADAANFVDGLALVYRDGKWGVIDRSGQAVIEPQYEVWATGPGSSAAFQDGLAAVMIGGKFGYIDTNGQIVIEPQFTGAEGFWNGLARVELEGQYGYIDRDGQFVWGPVPSAR